MYVVKLDGKVKGVRLRFDNAVRLATDLGRSIGWVNHLTRVTIERA